LGDTAYSPIESRCNIVEGHSLTTKRDELTFFSRCPALCLRGSWTCGDLRVLNP
jgi:hypothetical protein